MHAPWKLSLAMKTPTVTHCASIPQRKPPTNLSTQEYYRSHKIPPITQPSKKITLARKRPTINHKIQFSKRSKNFTFFKFFTKYERNHLVLSPANCIAVIAANFYNSKYISYNNKVNICSKKNLGTQAQKHQQYLKWPLKHYRNEEFLSKHKGEMLLSINVF